MYLEHDKSGAKELQSHRIMKEDLKNYNTLLHDIKQRVRQGQLRASLSANAEMLAAYWDIGRMIYERQQKEGWGAGVIPRLASDLKNELSGIKGFSIRNIARMVSFHLEYNEIAFLSPSVAKSIDLPLQNENNIQSSILSPSLNKSDMNFLVSQFAIPSEQSFGSFLNAFPRMYNLT